MHEFTYWVGIDTPGATPAQLEEFNDFYSRVHVPEVIAHNPGFLSGQRFELTKPDDRGDRGPTWLARYTLDAAGAERYVEENAGPGPVGSYSPFPEGIPMVPRWRLLWSTLSTAGSPLSGAPERLTLVGMDPAAGATEEDVREFNAFYDTVHVKEALHLMAAEHVTRYEISRSFLPDGEQPPRFAALYEYASPTPPAVAPVGPVSDGPPVYANRNTRWRLGYTRVTPPSGS